MMAAKFDFILHFDDTTTFFFNNSLRICLLALIRNLSKYVKNLFFMIHRVSLITSHWFICDFISFQVQSEMRSGEFVFVTGLIILLVALFAIWAFFKSIEVDDGDLTEFDLSGKKFLRSNCI